MKLTFSPPRGFNYQAGHYVQICCEQVSPEEWHPFTLSSAPEERYLTCHIRCPNELDWCSALRKKLVDVPVASLSQGVAKAEPGTRVTYKSFVHRSRPEDGEIKYDQPQMVVLGTQRFQVSNAASGAAGQYQGAVAKNEWEQKSLGDAAVPLPPLAICMRLDGPHGAPSELVWKHRVAVLVGAGIGVTPFASILRSVQLRPQKTSNKPDDNKPQSASQSASTWLRKIVTQAGEEEESVEEEWNSCETVYFYWLCRDQEEFEWFYDLLRDAVGTQKSIVVNLFTTGSVSISDAKPLGCGFQQFFGRPNWGRIFPKLAEDHPEEDIGIFLCGPAALRAGLQDGVRKAKGASAKHGSSFVIHAENF